MIPPHLFYRIYLSFLEQNDCTPPRCGELSDYTDSAHTQVEDPSLGSQLSKQSTSRSNGLEPLCLHTSLPTAYNNIIRVLNWGLIA